MIFIYPYKRKENDFLIKHSVKCVLKAHPLAGIYTIGDKVEGVDHIEHPDSNIIKGANVTSKLMRACNIFGEFVFMNDDFFINESFEFDVFRCGDLLERKEGKASIAWNQAVDNTKHWLEHNNLSTWSFECHQPILINAEKFKDTFSRINWRNVDHFIKSIYCNVNPSEYVKLIPNLKLIEPNTTKAQNYLDEYGCFSVGQGFLTEKGANFISKLTCSQ